MRIRKITPKEAYLLMGFSLEDYEISSKFSPKTALYHQAGNSIVVDVMYYLLKNLLNRNNYQN